MPYRIPFYRFLLLIIVSAFLYGTWKISLFNLPYDYESILVHIEPPNFASQSYTIDNRLLLADSRISFPKQNSKIDETFPYGIFPSNGTKNSNIRIYNQMTYIPPNYLNKKAHQKDKLIFIFDSKDYINFGDFHDCPVSKCRYTTDLKMISTADVLLWIDRINLPSHRRPKYQSWAILFQESPLNTPISKYLEVKARSMINWTLTYRLDSTIPIPYSKYSPFDLINPPPDRYPLPIKNYALGKKNMVAWFTSNCKPPNDRNEVVKELQKYIQVDVYGKCGKHSCPRSVVQSCFEMLNEHYKFYLAFENSYCRYYITEKFFLNGLSNNVIPIVLGAHPDDYRKVAPPHSYIHVDDFNTIKDLAIYLKYLDKNDTAFNEYFAWKPYGTTNLQHYFHCRFCMIAHLGDEVKTFYTNIHTWWHGENGNICFKSGKWKNHL